MIDTTKQDMNRNGYKSQEDDHETVLVILAILTQERYKARMNRTACLPACQRIR